MNPTTTQVHFGVKVELITFMQRFMTSCVNCPDLIRTDARLAANVALHARLADQRRWIRTVDRDRVIVRQKLREGGRAHAEFLAATYARNPFASGSVTVELRQQVILVSRRWRCHVGMPGDGTSSDAFDSHGRGAR